MLRAEFQEGLSKSGKYTQETIAELAPRIVNATHDTRHKAMIGRWAWSAAPIEADAYFLDPSTLTEADERQSLFYRKPAGDTVVFGISVFRAIARPRRSDARLRYLSDSPRGRESSMDALRISPQYTSVDWRGLDINAQDHWPKAANIVRDRLEGRFLRFATDCLKSNHSGFVVLAIDCLLAETIQQFKDGVTHGRGRSEEMVTRFLEGARFQPDFDDQARRAFYRDIRCGLLHQAEAKKMWLIRRAQQALLQKVEDGQGYIVDVKRFHDGMQGSLDDYLALVAEPASEPVRTNLWKDGPDLQCS